jgi:assimilatory nitrate reductase catalytic subunit
VIRKVARAPGVALADFSIFRLIAEAWGCGDDFLKWSSPATVFQILKKLSAGRPCDFSGIRDYEHLSDAGGIQWPYPAAPAAQNGGEVATMSAQERRLFADGRFYHPDGRARFEFEASRPLPEVVNEQFPLQLNTGRGTAAQWHTGTRTSKSAVLRKLAPQRLYAELNPLDARRLGVAAQETILIASRRGQLRATAVLTPAVPEGQVFLPMHYNATNRLTDAVFDPYSRQPAYKACAVRVERVTRPD